MNTKGEHHLSLLFRGLAQSGESGGLISRVSWVRIPGPLLIHTRRQNMYYAYQRILSRIVVSRWGEVATLRQMKRYDK